MKRFLIVCCLFSGNPAFSGTNVGIVNNRDTYSNLIGEEEGFPLQGATKKEIDAWNTAINNGTEKSLIETIKFRDKLKAILRLKLFLHLYSGIEL